MERKGKGEERKGKGEKAKKGRDSVRSRELEAYMFTNTSSIYVRRDQTIYRRT